MCENWKAMDVKFKFYFYLIFKLWDNGIWNIKISTWVCHVSLRFLGLVLSCPKQFSPKYLFSLKQISKSFQSQYHLDCPNHQLNFQLTKQKWFVKKKGLDLHWKILDFHFCSFHLTRFLELKPESKNRYRSRFFWTSLALNPCIYWKFVIFSLCLSDFPKLSIEPTKNGYFFRKQKENKKLKNISSIDYIP